MPYPRAPAALVVGSTVGAMLTEKHFSLFSLSLFSSPPLLD